MATLVRNTFTTDVGEMQRRSYRVRARSV